jgi:hypothetical protein
MLLGPHDERGVAEEVNTTAQQPKIFRGFTTVDKPKFGSSCSFESDMMDEMSVSAEYGETVTVS